MPKGTITYKTLMFALDFSYYNHIYKKKPLQIVCATKECDSDSKKWCLLLKWMVTKTCVTQTRMLLRWS
jgi:hypothetical protein